MEKFSQQEEQQEDSGETHGYEKKGKEGMIQDFLNVLFLIRKGISALVGTTLNLVIPWGNSFLFGCISLSKFRKVSGGTG